MNNEQFEQLMTLGNNVVDSMFAFGLTYVLVGAVVSIISVISAVGRRWAAIHWLQNTKVAVDGFAI